MAHKKRLDDKAYQRLMSSVTDFSTRYKKIQKVYEDEKTLYAGKKKRTRWQKLVMNEKPAGMTGQDWLALVAEYQVSVGIIKKNEPSPVRTVTQKEPVSIRKQAVRALKTVSNQLTFF